MNVRALRVLTYGMASLASALPLQVMAAITVNGDDVAIETCGFPANQSYSVTVQRTDLKQGGSVNSSGCVKTTFRDGKARAGDNLIIEVAGRRSSETVPGSSGGGSGGGGSTQPSDNRDTANIGKVRDTAENQARFFANRVIIVYGGQENFRYNYQRGLIEGINLYNWSTISGVQNTFEFREGYARGQNDGRAQGRSAGQDEGQSQGRSQGAAAAFGRYEAVVDQNRNPDTQLRIPQVRSSGMTSNLSVPSMENRLSQLDAIAQSRLAGLRFGDSDYMLPWEWNEYWSPRTLYGWRDFRFDLVSGWYREEHAWDLYQRRALGGNYGSMDDYLEKISDPSRTTNAAEARSAFESSFKREYNSVIDSKWRNAVMASNPTARRIGQDIGETAAREYTRDLGYSHGYSLSFTPASAQGYDETFAPAYSDSFNSTVRNYESNAVIGSLQGRILDGQGQTNFVLGAPVSVTITKLVNFGRQNTDVQVSAGAGLVPVQTKSFRLEYSTSLKAPRTESGIGLLAVAPAPGKSASVQVKVGSLTLSETISLRWDNQVAALARPGQHQQMVQNYIVQHLTAEWTRLDNTLKNHYLPGDKTEDTLVEQLVRKAQSLSSEERKVLQTMKPALKAVYGKKKFFSGEKWRTATGLIDQI